MIRVMCSASTNRRSASARSTFFSAARSASRFAKPIRPDRPGAEGVDLNPLGDAGRRERLCERQQRRVHGAAYRELRPWCSSADPRDIDNRPAGDL